MKKFLSILLATLMVLSNVSYAIPSAIEAMDTATEIVVVPEADEAEETQDEAELSASPNYNKEYGLNLYRLHFDNAQGGEAVGSGWTGNTAAVLLGWGAEGELASSNICLWANHGTTLGKEENGNVYLHFDRLVAAEMVEMRENGSFTMSTDKIYTFTFDVKTDFTTDGTGKIHNYRVGSNGSTCTACTNVTFPANSSEWHTYTMTYKPTAAGQKPDFSMFGTGTVPSGAFDVDNISIYEKAATATIKVVDTKGNVLGTKTGVSTTGVAVSTIIDGLYNPDGQTATVKFNGKEYAPNDTIVFGGGSTVVLEVEDNADYNMEYGKNLYRLHFDNAQGGETVPSGWGANDTTNSDRLKGWGVEGTLASSNDIRMWTNHGTTLGKEENGNVYLHFSRLVAAEMVEMRENGSYTMSTDKIYTFTFDVKTGFTTDGTGKIHNYRDTSTNVNVIFPADTDWHTYTMTYKPTAAGQKPDFSIWGTGTVPSGAFDVDNISIYEKPATATINIVDSKGALLGTKTGVSTTGVTVSTLISGLYDADNQTATITFNDKEYAPNDTIIFGGNSTIVLEVTDNADYNKEYGKNLYRLHFDNVTDGTTLTSGWSTTNSYVLADWGTIKDASMIGEPALWLYGGSTRTLVKEADNGFLRLALPLKDKEIINFNNATSVRMEAGKKYVITLDARANAASDPTTPGANYLRDNSKGYNSTDAFVLPNDNEWHTYTIEYTPSANEDYKSNIYFYQEAYKTAGAGTLDIDNISIYETVPTATVKVADEKGNILKTLENQNTATKIPVSTLISGLYDADNQTATVSFNGKTFAPNDTIVFGGGSTVVLEVEDNADYNKEYGKNLYRLHFDNAQGGETVPSGWGTNDTTNSDRLKGWGVEGTLASSNDIRMWANHGTTLGKEENGNVYLHFSRLVIDEMVEMRENGSFTMSTDKVYTFSFDVKTGFTTAGTGYIKNYRDTSTNINVTFPADTDWHTYTLTYKPNAAGQKPDFSIFGSGTAPSGAFDVDNISIYEKAATATINVVDSKGALLGTKTGVSTTGVTVSSLIDGLYNAGDVVYVNFNGKDFLPEETICFGGTSTITLVCSGEEPIEPDAPKVATVTIVDEIGEPIVTLVNVKSDGILVSELISGLYDSSDNSKLAYVIFNGKNYNPEDEIVFGTDSTVTLVVRDNPYFSEKYGTALYQLHFDNVTNGASVGNNWQQAATWGTYKDSAIDFDGRMWLINAGNTMVKEDGNGFLRLNVPFSGDEIFNFHPETANVSLKKGYTYTFTADMRVNAPSHILSTDNTHNYMYFAKAYKTVETTNINVPNDNEWHTYSVSYTPTADEEWGKAAGDYIYLFQKEYMSEGAGTFDIDNITIYEIESKPTVVKLNMQNGNNAASDIKIPASAGYNLDDNGNILMDPNSTLDLNELASYVIDEGNMDFIGFNTDANATTALTSVSSTAMGGEIVLYAVWAEQDVNELYSVEFDTNSGYSMFSQKKQDGTYNDLYYNFGGKGTIYQEGYDPRNTPLTENGFITHDGNGYITLNYDATADYNAIYNAYFFLGSLDKEAYISANSGIEKMVIRARVRGEDALAAGSYTTASGSATYTPASFAPVNALHYGAEETAGLTTFSGSLKRVDLTSIGANQWFTYEIDMTSITDAIHYMRLDMNYTMPTGTKLDIDYIRFIGGDVGTTTSLKNKTSIRATYRHQDLNGVRVVASATDRIAGSKDDVDVENGTLITAGASDIGYMITASAKWQKAGYGWSDLTMDKYSDSSINVNGKLIIAGFLRQDNLQKVNWYDTENDEENLFAAVLYGIPVKNYRSPFIVRPFAKINGIYTYGEPFEVNFLEIADSVYDRAPEIMKTYIDNCRTEYAAYLAAAEVSGNIDESFANLLATPKGVTDSLIIPTNDTKPVKISDDYYTITAWKNGSLDTYTVYTKGTFPAIINENGELTDAYADEPCVIADTGSGSFYLKSIAHSRAGSENGTPNGINTSLADFDGDSAMLASHVDNPASPVQRLDKGSSDSSFFLGDYAYGTYEYNYGGGNTSELDMNLGKTALVNSNTMFVAKYVLPGETLWTTYAASQLNTLADNTDEWSNGEEGTAYFTTYPHGLEFNSLTYVVSNNTEKSDKEDLVLLAGVMNFDNVTTSESNAISGSYDASLYKKILVKTTNSIDTVTVKFTRDDGKTGSITSTCYATVGNERLFDIDLYGVPEYHGTITKFNIYKNTSNSIGSNLKNVYLVANGHDSSATLTKTSSAFDDEGFTNGFVVRDLDQEYNKSSFTGTLGYFNAANQSNVAWAVNPWYSYDYSNGSANKANYELTANGNILSDDAGSKIIKYNENVNINGTTSDTLTMTLNASKIYNGKSHSQMVDQGMTYWPHLLLEQNTEIPSVSDKQYAVNADVVKAEMDIRMTSMSGYGDNKTEFLVYVYLRPKADPTQRIWFGIQLFSSSSTMNFPNWKRDTGASQYIYSIPQEIVFDGEANSFWTSKTSWGSTTYSVAPSSTWKHIDLDLTDHIDRALDWINREDGFGLGKVLTKDDIYIDGVNLGFETHGGVDATFEIANFNINSYTAN